MKLHETVAMIIIMTLLPLIFLVPAVIFEFLERKQQKMFQFLLEFRPKKFIIPVNSISEEQFKSEKQFNRNVNRSREEIRAIFSARNCPSSRELRKHMSLLCTSPTQQSSSCTTRKDDAREIRKYQRNVNTDIESSSAIQSSSMNSEASTPKKSSITNDKFETSRSRRGTNLKEPMHLKRSSSLSATTRSFTRSLSEKS
ncbi:hypothetical protein WUBG_07717 [Wuchereria bancrofti]|uniref:Uncharacterized protein n=1 Tax=Wuchereria bancrofti TaxID=6293 RepID=J9F1Z8_WUCBA|nr:hypothetical protein WUBG_07717 [Wuchereria bancrofti]VDM08942.1 unnamed protein product [Wuchereria bancrofti]